MHGIHGVLWTGDAHTFPSQQIQRAPALDLVWEPDPDRLPALLPGHFDAAVVDFGEVEPARTAIARIHEVAPDLPVLVRTRAPSSTRLHALTEAGASRLLVVDEPSEALGQDALFDALAELISKRARLHASRKGHAEPVDEASTLVGDSGPMRELRTWIRRAAPSRANVLICGETGTGKERVACALHALGKDASGPFVALNCAALPESLLESELVGYRRGAFTGAERDRRGLVAEANGGTLFLDEVAESSPAFQAKLLRILQERRVRPLGSSREYSVDVRFVAATHRNLREEMVRGRFREDLYYRLAVLVVELPPLRGRPGDVAILAHHLLANLDEQAPPCRLSPQAIRRLEAHGWPGNVRELENELQRALALALPGESLGPECFLQRQGGASTQAIESFRAGSPHETLRETLMRLERQIVSQRLKEHGGRRTATARSLGVTREGLWKKLKRLGIE